jgi:hypothetical protein
MARKRKLTTKTKKGAAAKKQRAPSKGPSRAPSRTPRTKTKARAQQKTPSTAQKKSAATRGAAQRAAEVKKFEKTAAKRYGKNAQTTKRLKELTANARRWELEARKSKSLSGKQRARREAGKALAAARLTFRTATSQATHGQAKQRGWVEVERFDGSRQEVNTFSSYEHARHGAGSVLSLLESRPGVVGVLSWRRVSQVENVNASGLTPRGELRESLQQRAADVAQDLRMTERERAEFFELLLEAELYGVEMELEVENYVET